VIELKPSQLAEDSTKIFNFMSIVNTFQEEIKRRSNRVMLAINEFRNFCFLKT
jgi:hypothetical protein